MNATFGVAASRSVCSVVKTVKTTCQGRLRCNVTASPSLCDPGQQDPGTLISTLTVIYRCSEREVKYRLAQVDRPLKAELSCADLLQ